MIPLSELEYQYYLLSQKQKIVGASSSHQLAYQPDVLKQELQRTSHLYTDLKQLYRNSRVYVYDDEPIPSGCVNESSQGGWKKGQGYIKPVNNSTLALTLISVSSHKVNFEEVYLYLHISDRFFQPWNNLLTVVGDNGYYIHPETIPADTSISVSIKYKTERGELEVNSLGHQILILKNQDPAPSAQCQYPTLSLDKVLPYLDKQYLVLSPHQAFIAIDLSPYSYERDWQDIILLATFINQEPEKARLCPLVLPRLGESSDTPLPNKFCTHWRIGKGSICPSSLYKPEIQILYAAYRLNNKSAIISLHLEFGEEQYDLISNSSSPSGTDITTVNSTRIFSPDLRISAHTPISFVVRLWEDRSTVGSVLFQERHSRRQPLFILILRDQDTLPPLKHIRPELRPYIKNGRISINKNQALCLIDLKPFDSVKRNFQDVIFLVNLINLDYSLTTSSQSERIIITSHPTISFSPLILKVHLLNYFVITEINITCIPELVTYIPGLVMLEQTQVIQPQLIIGNSVDLFLQVELVTRVKLSYLYSEEVTTQVEDLVEIAIQYRIESQILVNVSFRDFVQIAINQLAIISYFSVQNTHVILPISQILTLLKCMVSISTSPSIRISVTISQLHTISYREKIDIIETIREYDPDIFIDELSEPKREEYVDRVELDTELTIDHLETILPEVKKELDKLEEVVASYRPTNLDIAKPCFVVKKPERDYGRLYTIEQIGREVTLTTQWLHTYQKAGLLPGQVVKLYSDTDSKNRYIANGIITTVSEDKTIVLVRSLSHRSVDYGETYSWWGEEADSKVSRWIDVTPLRRAVSETTEAKVMVEVQSRDMVGSLEWKLYYREPDEREVSRIVAEGLDREKPGYCMISKAGARFGKGIYIIKINVKITPAKTITSFYKTWVVEEQTELLAASRYELTRYEQ